jgi:sensor histidine kinase YesM
MKKTIIASLVGGIILFMWQFLSNTVLNLHRPMQEYTPKQGEILEYLGKNLEEGFYYLPTYPAGTSQEEATKIMEESMGKPWAQIYYHKAAPTSITMNMVRSLVIDILAVFLLVWVVSQMSYPSFKTILFSSLAIGLLSYFTTAYGNSIWFETKSIPDLIDSVVSWGAIGAWLGWFLRR